MEAYVDDVVKLRHYTSVSGTPTAATTPVLLTVYDGDTQIFQGEADSFINAETGEFRHHEITLSTHGLEEKEYTAVWSYMLEDVSDTIEKQEKLRVVKPYVDYHVFQDIYGDIDYREFKQSERIVRGVIDSHCRQRFGRLNEYMYTLNGSGHDVLELPDRLIKLHEVRVADTDSEFYNINEYVTADEDEKYRIRRKQWDAFRAGMNPVSRTAIFRAGSIYKVIGDWGWESLPAEVNKAAEILLNDYQCADSRYREKFIQNIRAADWRMEFAVTGNETTGNANADILLADYRKLLWEVI